MDGWSDRQTNQQYFCPFYKTLSLIKTATLLNRNKQGYVETQPETELYRRADLRGTNLILEVKVHKIGNERYLVGWIPY